MKLSAVTFLALSFAGASQAWDVTIYPNVNNCKVRPGGEYRALWGSDTACHNFARTSGATCRHFTNGGSKWKDCDSNIMVSASQNARGAKTTCDFFKDADCRGRRLSLNDRICMAGALRSFRCR